MYMEDLLWLARQESRNLRELRLVLRTVWADQASRDANSRYLDPLERTDVEMLLHLDEQLQASNEAHGSVESAGEEARRIMELSHEVAAEVRELEQDLRRAFIDNDASRRSASAAVSEFARVRHLLESAEAVC